VIESGLDGNAWANRSEAIAPGRRRNVEITPIIGTSMMRGVEKQHSATITSSMRGAFRDKKTRYEFLRLTPGQGTAF